MDFWSINLYYRQQWFDWLIVHLHYLLLLCQLLYSEVCNNNIEWLSIGTFSAQNANLWLFNYYFKTYLNLIFYSLTLLVSVNFIVTRLFTITLKVSRHNLKIMKCLTYLMLVCPPRSHTWNFRFLYVTCSTLNPIVGIVVTTSPTCSLYSIVVFPAPSKPRINILISRAPSNPLK